MTQIPDLKPYPGPEHQAFEFGKGPGGALLIHGFPGTPAEVRGIGTALAKNGWHTRGPLLPGFGPDIVNLAEKRREDWLRAVEAEWVTLNADYDPCVLIGFSMGGALALHLAERLPPDKLVLIAPFYHLPGFLPKLAPILKMVMPVIRPFKDADFSNLEVRAGFKRLMPGVDLDDSEVQAYLREEITLPTVVIDEVLRLGGEAYRIAGYVSAPTLVIQGNDDQTVRPDLTRKLVKRMRSANVIYRGIDGDHELIHEHSGQKTIVTELIVDFLMRIQP
jgi:carboxylesterase